MNKSTPVGRGVCAAIFIFISMPSAATLIDNGGGLIYDDVLNITWSQPDNTARYWDDTNIWVLGLTLSGVSSWRLPTIAGVGALIIAAAIAQSEN